MDRIIERMRGIVVTVDHTTVDAARAIHALSDTDLVRLKALARLWSRGLPGGLGWADVLNEAIVRVLDGSRPWPPGVPLLAFLSGVMRSICDDHWRRARREASARRPGRRRGATPRRHARTRSGRSRPRRRWREVDRLFAGDRRCSKIIAGLAEGLTRAKSAGSTD